MLRVFVKKDYVVKEEETLVDGELFCDACGKPIERGSHFYKTFVEYGEISHKKKYFDACSYECYQKEIDKLRSVGIFYMVVSKKLFVEVTRIPRDPDMEDNIEKVEVIPRGSKRVATLELIQNLSEELSNAYKDLEKLDEEEQL